MVDRRDIWDRHGLERHDVSDHPDAQDVAIGLADPCRSARCHLANGFLDGEHPFIQDAGAENPPERPDDPVARRGLRMASGYPIQVAPDPTWVCCHPADAEASRGRWHRACFLQR